MASTILMSTNGTTPLLLLLDGILSQDVERVKMSVSEMRTRLQAAASRTANCAEDMMMMTMMTTSLVEPVVEPSAFSLILPFQEVVASPSDISSASADDENERVAIQLLQSIPLLVSLIQQVLHVFPQWAQTCSALDGSLPLHCKCWCSCRYYIL
jgi:hypothetical protein